MTLSVRGNLIIDDAAVSNLDPSSPDVEFMVSIFYTMSSRPTVLVIATGHLSIRYFKLRVKFVVQGLMFWRMTIVLG